MQNMVVAWLKMLWNSSFLRSNHQLKGGSTTEQQEESGRKHYISVHHITRLTSGKYSEQKKLTSLTFSVEKSGGALKKCKTFVGEKMPSTKLSYIKTFFKLLEHVHVAIHFKLSAILSLKKRKNKNKNKRTESNLKDWFKFKTAQLSS